MKDSKIEWTDHTFNPWIGCQKVSPGCANCYAEARDIRFSGGHWGKAAPRERTSPSNWNEPLKWNSYERCTCDSGDTLIGGDCNYCGDMARRPRVFCPSLADWLDEAVPLHWFVNLLSLIQQTPNLDWQLLTKRPENFYTRLKNVICDFQADDAVTEFAIEWAEHLHAPHNVWLGASVEDQERARERIPELLTIPAKVHFLSCEPMLGALQIERYLGDVEIEVLNAISGECAYSGGIEWVICGGESGSKARPMHPEWARSLRDQCEAAKVPFFFKQWGEWWPVSQMPMGESDRECRRKNAAVILHPDGHIISDWPPGAMLCLRTGKKASGRLLDGREWHEFPLESGVFALEGIPT